VDERQRNHHRREEPDDGNVGHQRERKAQAVQAATVRLEHLRHFAGRGVVCNHRISK